MSKNTNQFYSGDLSTPWTHMVDQYKPHPEYPRPQMVREEWQNLNGLWDYQITPFGFPTPNTFLGQILVPFPVESKLSGVQRRFKPDELLWYRRYFNINPAWKSGRILLHFGAVDHHCKVYVNGSFIGEHIGGYDPFFFDITDTLQENQNELIVCVSDPTDTQPIQRGKQVLKPGFIWYSAHSGIWQTVWLEFVPMTYLHRITVDPDIDNHCVRIIPHVAHATEDLKVLIKVFDQGVKVAEGETNPDTQLSLPLEKVQLWSPETPHLLDLEIILKNNQSTLDRVQSYFGMRKFSLDKDRQGRLRFYLNNKPLFLYGPLDQGYWPDGLSTPPTDQAIQWELRFLKEAGFNMLRKHIKVESARYYYHCDRLGLIVWQDMVSGGISPKPLWFLFAPLFKNMSDNKAYWRLGRAKKENRDQFKLEYQRMIAALFNFVSIAIWCPFNEGWGQFDGKEIATWTKELDPTRLVDHASGWFDQGAGDFKSEHIYFQPLPTPQPDPNRGWVLSEFGGYSLKLPQHTWNPNKDFGYKKFNNTQTLTQAYIDLLENQLIPWIKAGLSAAVYTQTTDVETEVNGFLTYDRKAVKMELPAIVAAHRKIMQVSQTSDAVDQDKFIKNDNSNYKKAA